MTHHLISPEGEIKHHGTEAQCKMKAEHGDAIVKIGEGFPVSRLGAEPSKTIDKSEKKSK